MKENIWISGFWRRIAAFVLDCFILGAVGFLLGIAFEPKLVELGGAGKIVGFVIAIVYFGFMNSHIFKGQTLGKRLMKLRVVNIENHCISVGRSFVRYFAIGVPYFINGAKFDSVSEDSILAYVISFVFIGGLGSIIYLYLFNRRTRQSLHDLIVGTYVVNATVPYFPVERIWRYHFIAVGILFIAGIAIPIFALKNLDQENFSDLINAQKELMNLPEVRYASINEGVSNFHSSNYGDKTTKYISAQVWVKEDIIEDDSFAKKVANVLVINIKGSKEKDLIQIVTSYGYDIGIWSFSHSQQHRYTPNQLEPIYPALQSNKRL